MRPNKRDELVRKALKVFYREGFHAAGMDLLARETGISKTSMYKHFRTKEDLILAVLRLRDENFRNDFIRRVEDFADTPRGRLIASFDALGAWFAKPDFRSCLFIKAASEYQDRGHPIHAISAEHKRLLQNWMIDLARRAGARDPETLAHALMLLQEGAIVTAHLGHMKDPAGEAKAAAQTLVAAAIP